MIIRENVPLSELTTMRLGGPARFVIEIETEDDCRDAFDFAADKNLPVYFLGSGANSIGKDEGFPGIILINRLKGIKTLEESPDRLVVEAAGGENWDDFVDFVCQKGFSGVEAMSKIPGTVGAAPVQNIGAYGQELKDTLKSVSAFDSLLSEFVEIDASSMDFSYRHSIFNSGEKAGRFFILSCVFEFTSHEMTPPFYASLQSFLDENKILDRSPATIRSAVSKIRSEKLPDPDETPSAGSFFKNIYLDKLRAAKAREKGVPVRETEKLDADGKPYLELKVNTGWLLEHSGLKGKTFHGFEISDKAALVLINRSAKTEHELELAKSEISATVKSKFGLTLDQEPVYIEEPRLSDFNQEESSEEE